MGHLLERQGELMNERRAVLRRLLYHREPSQMNYVIEDPRLAPHEELIRQAVWEFGKITGAKGTVRFRATTDDRSFHSEGVIYLSPGGRTNPITIIHEMGHWYERQYGLTDLVAAWLDERTQGEAPIPLKTFGEGYDDDEYTRPDRFLHPYIGKVYTHNGRVRATEVLSMGLEWLYAYPLEFARGDPDMFDRVIEWTAGVK